MARSLIGPRIRDRRRQLGITQAGLAARVDISASYLNLIEGNKRNIGGALLRRIADETGAKIGGTLYSDALTGEKGEAPTFIDLIRHNIRTLSAALSG